MEPKDIKEIKETINKLMKISLDIQKYAGLIDLKTEEEFRNKAFEKSIKGIISLGNKLWNNTYKLDSWFYDKFHIK